jgi:hypothetical protein
MAIRYFSRSWRSGRDFVIEVLNGRCSIVPVRQMSCLKEKIFEDPEMETEFRMKGHIVRPFLNANELQKVQDLYDRYTRKCQQMYLTRCKVRMRTIVDESTKKFAKAHREA